MTTSYPFLWSTYAASAMIEHYIDMPDGTQLKLVTDGREAYPTRVVTQMEAIWINQQLDIMGVPERVKGKWERNGS